MICVIRMMVLVLLDAFFQQCPILMIGCVKRCHWVMITAFSHDFRMGIQQVRDNLARYVVSPAFILVHVNKMHCHTSNHFFMMVRGQVQVVFNIGPERFLNRHMIGVNFEIHDLTPVIKWLYYWRVG